MKIIERSLEENLYLGVSSHIGASQTTEQSQLAHKLLYSGGNSTDKKKSTLIHPFSFTDANQLILLIKSRGLGPCEKSSLLCGLNGL